jgi:acetolactate decarboxylase
MRYVNLLMALLVILAVGCSASKHSTDTLFQVSTIDALLEGIYDGEMAFGELKEHGDFGIGTFDALDGEMIALDGAFYQIKADGVAYPADDSMTTPFAAVTFFEPDASDTLPECADYSDLQEQIDGLLPTDNIFYAIRIDGSFNYVKVRSVPRQQEPYVPLAEAVKDQTVFDLHDVEGTIVAFRCPCYVEGINVVGYHFHFITADRLAGGHLLELQAEGLTVEVDYTPGFEMLLPQTDDFYQLDLAGSRQEELDEVE